MRAIFIFKNFNTCNVCRACRDIVDIVDATQLGGYQHYCTAW